MDNDAVINCVHAYVLLICHVHFPSCEETQSEYREQKICRETCLNFIRLCGKIWDVVVKAYTIRNPDPAKTKRVHCKIQRYRNAGDSPECWYSDLKDSAGNIRMRQ